MELLFLSVKPKTFVVEVVLLLLVYIVTDNLLQGSLFVSVIVRRGEVAIYQFSGVSTNRDISGYVNPPAKFVGVYYSRGPDKNPKSALSFRGNSHSYVLIPNNGCLDTKFSITILFWVYPETTGPLFHFNPNSWGVHLWIVKGYKLSFGVMPRSGKSGKRLYYPIKPRMWSYIGATYDHKTELATLWIDSIAVEQIRIRGLGLGLATNHPIVIGQKPRDRRRFRGRISCLQIYNYAMDGVKMRSEMTRCYKSGELRTLLCPP